MRSLILTVCMSLVSLVAGCGGAPPAEETGGDPVPPDYELQQQEAQKAAREAAMKGGGK